MKNLYLAVTADEYEYPVFICTKIKDIASWLNVSYGSAKYYLGKGYCKKNKSIKLKKVLNEGVNTMLNYNFDGVDYTYEPSWSATKTELARLIKQDINCNYTEADKIIQFVNELDLWDEVLEHYDTQLRDYFAGEAEAEYNDTYQGDSLSSVEGREWMCKE